MQRMKKGWEYGGGPGRSRRTESEVSSESNAIIQGMNRASPYSPQEKKQRIERYRSKRNHRNFTKKIKVPFHSSIYYTIIQYLHARTLHLTVYIYIYIYIHTLIN